MDDKNDNIKEMSESQNKNSVIVKGDNVNVTNQIVINNYYGTSGSSGVSNGNEPEKQGDVFPPKQRKFSFDSFFDPVTTVATSLISVLLWVLLAKSHPIISLFIIPAVQSIAGYFGFRSAEKCIGRRIHSFLCSAIMLSAVLILISNFLYNNSTITYEMLYGCLLVLVATNMISFFLMYFNIALFNGKMRSV
ncbi:MAG: hypothetical protein MSH15_14900 [Oscillospiraceae bacterium]|nr:hypothetical protein [Oscillospiraceae bacterium]